MFKHSLNNIGKLAVYICDLNYLFMERGKNGGDKVRQKKRSILSLFLVLLQLFTLVGLFPAKEVHAGIPYPANYNSSKAGEVRVQDVGVSNGATVGSLYLRSWFDSDPFGAWASTPTFPDKSETKTPKGQRVNFWYEAACGSGPDTTLSESFDTYVDSDGRFLCSYWLGCCSETTSNLTVTLTNNSSGAFYTVGSASHGNQDSGRELIGSFVKTGLAAGTYTVSVSGGTSGSHSGGERQIGWYVWGIKFQNQFETHLSDKDRYASYASPTTGTIDLPITVDSYKNITNSTVANWSRKKNPSVQNRAGSSTSIEDRGANWGSNTTAGYYHPGYKYVSDSGKKTIPAYVPTTVYRYFDPIRYTVRLHENRPSNATYAIVEKATSRPGTDTSPKYTKDGVETGSGFGENSGIYKKSDFVYNHTSLEAPATLFSLRGWTVTVNTKYMKTATSPSSEAGYPVGANQKLTTTENGVIDMYVIWTPNKYTVTYKTRLNNNSAAVGTHNTNTTREELNGRVKYGSNTVENISTKVSDKTKQVTMDSTYNVGNNNITPAKTGLLQPRAQWSVELYPHGNDDYVVQNGTMRTDIALANKNFKFNVESTFLRWNRDGVSGLFDYGPVDIDTKMQTDSNHNLYADWENNSTVFGVPERRYTITFDAEDGTFTSDDVTIPDASKPDIGTKIDEWEFKGWRDEPCDLKSYTDPSFTGRTCKHDQLLVTDGASEYAPTCHLKVYAHWYDPRITLPVVEKPGYEFVGWYPIPQTDPDKPTDLSKLIYYGGGTDWDYEDKSKYDFDGDMTLYAWYNKKPVFVDIHEGYFFEGQDITWSNLLELIGVFDYEDNYDKLAKSALDKYFNDLETRIDNDLADQNEKLNELKRVDLDIYLDETDPDSTRYHEEKAKLEAKIAETEDNIFRLSEERAAVGEARVEALKAVEMRLIQPVIAKIKFYADGSSGGVRNYSGTDSHTRYADGSYIKIANSYDKDVYDNLYLNTSTRNIGYFDITFQVHDMGIKLKDIVGGKGDIWDSLDDDFIIPNSDITIEYTRRCQLNFNFSPTVRVQNVIEQTDPEFDSLAEYMLGKMAVTDPEDTQNNMPWWTATDGALLEGVRHHFIVDGETKQGVPDQTLQKLQDTLIITGVTELLFDSAFEFEHPDVTEAFRAEFTSEEGNPYKGSLKDVVYSKADLLDEIYAFKDSGDDYHGVKKSEVWDNLTGMKITFDAVDQWGKYASAHVSNYAQGTGSPGSPGDPDDPDNPPIPPTPTPGPTGELPDGSDPDNPVTDPDPGTPPTPPVVPPVDPDDPPREVNKDKPPTEYPPEVLGGNDPENLPPKDDQDEPERTIGLVFVNKDIDADLALIRVNEHVRYISRDWIESASGSWINGNDYKDTLKGSWWGANIELLKDAFKNKDAADEGTAPNTTDTGTINGSSLEINVRDYTEE